MSNKFCSNQLSIDFFSHDKKELAANKLNGIERRHYTKIICPVETIDQTGQERKVPRAKYLTVKGEGILKEREESPEIGASIEQMDC